ncbi:MAG: DNA methylase [Acidobacteria bacterium RIFCSPLOWO2_02_FULL_61_28]|nr:MAG: DNA methylase [Acidobacteria bacterium RIFCSPLOWO2_02_FULL_61_28]
MPGTAVKFREKTDFVDSVICDDALSALSLIRSGIVDAIVTSPPYYGQRDYSYPNQIGSEATAEAYLERLLEVFKECMRVLKETGTLWLNLGDKYADGRLLGLPWRLALALQANGWILRSDVIWWKPNAMPSSVKNRLTCDHEYLFFLTKNNAYYFDGDAIREPHVTFSEHSRMMGGRNHFGKRGGTPEKGKNCGNQNLHRARWDQAFHPKGRNKRTVWEVPLSKFPDAHFAVFPEKLIEPCILAGSPDGGLVLDPFIGSGTTALVALRLRRHFIGIDCSKRYCEMAENRIREQSLVLPFSASPDL